MDESALKILLVNLETCRSSLNSWLSWATLLVVIGVVLEVVFVIWEYREDLHDFRRGVLHPPEKPSVWLLVFGLFGSILIAVGVAGELYIGTKIGTVETKIRGANDLRAALLSKESAQLEKKAAEITASVAPRRLTTEQSTSVSSNLFRFKGQPVVAISNTFDVEASVLAAEVLTALKSAKWNTNPNWSIDSRVSSLKRAPYIPVTGIRIQSSSDIASRLAAKALSRELSTNGFDCLAANEGEVGFGPTSAPIVIVEVEARPQGPQGEAKLSSNSQNVRH
jgi:hypothetical protein